MKQISGRQDHPRSSPWHVLQHQLNAMKQCPLSPQADGSVSMSSPTTRRSSEGSSHLTVKKRKLSWWSKKRLAAMPRKTEDTIAQQPPKLFQQSSRRHLPPIGNLSTGRFRGNRNFSDRNSLGRKQRYASMLIDSNLLQEFERNTFSPTGQPMSIWDYTYRHHFAMGS